MAVVFLSAAANVAAQGKPEIENKMLNTKIVLSQKVAKYVAEQAEKEAIKTKFNVSIAVVNEAGQLLHFTRMDESTNSSVDISIAKAKHAAYYGRDTKVQQDALTNGNTTVLALPHSLPIEGGVQLIYQGKAIGAIGVSGATREDDGKIAKAGADLMATLK
ncbi:GlcG/HbpS family heme-binding protein [Hymenobacter terrenus]|uniref:GlcG/HbpS family heme-binding protein n=1 Tax=Hymenobacter terrenus TaxID=1629124 RepID=UPI0018CE1B8A|nr:heme-binding protein [Hymenobacter terrenus]